MDLLRYDIEGYLYAFKKVIALRLHQVNLCSREGRSAGRRRGSMMHENWRQTFKTLASMN